MSPAAAELPSLPALIFDGDCGFCTTWARRWQGWWHLRNVEPWQFVDLDAYGLSEQACQEAVQWVDESGVAHAGEWAVIAALRNQGGVWALAGRVLAVPGVSHLAGLAYRFVARYRYSLPGGTPACKIGRDPD